MIDTFQIVANFLIIPTFDDMWVMTALRQTRQTVIVCSTIMAIMPRVMKVLLSFSVSVEMFHAEVFLQNTTFS